MRAGGAAIGAAKAAAALVRLVDGLLLQGVGGPYMQQPANVRRARPVPPPPRRPRRRRLRGAPAPRRRPTLPTRSRGRRAR